MFRLGVQAFVWASLFSFSLHAEFKLTVIQTADLHSHFTNSQSAYGMGGLARIAKRVSEIKAMNSNSLFLDAGDYSEGTMFFAVDSGETTNRILEAMNYDALVLGNHDWLIGPRALYDTLLKSNFQVPILSANLDFSELPKNIDLKSYIHPYIIKQFGDIKVGIIGLSTFQFVFDSFLKPVVLREPTRMARHYAKKLKEAGCQIIIVLSHLGVAQDKLIARFVPGVDLIVGGHTHYYLPKPLYVNKVPITHVGRWGEYVGEIELTYDKGITQLTEFRAHPIYETLEEEPIIKALVDGAILKIENTFGPIFNDNLLHTEVDLPAENKKTQDLLGDWAADAIYKESKADLAIDSPTYATSNFMRGFVHTIDVFNVFPHIFNPETQQSWTIQNIELSGISLKLLMAAIFRVGLNLRLSHAEAVLDYSKYFNRLHSLKVDGKPIENFRKYKVGMTKGVLQTFDFIAGWGFQLIHGAPIDTNKEAWRAIRDYLVTKNPITRDSLKWEWRVKSLQPDLVIAAEEFRFVQKDFENGALDFYVRNTGVQASTETNLNISLSSIEDQQKTLSLFALNEDGARIRIPRLKSGEAFHALIPITVAPLNRGRHPMLFEVEGSKGELNLSNNQLKTFIDVQ